MIRLKFFTLIILSILISDFSVAQVKSGKPFEIDFAREAIIFGVGSAASVAGFAILEKVKPLTIDEIIYLNPQNVNSFDRDAIGPYHEDVMGDILLFSSYFLPATFLLHGEAKNDFLDLALIYSEVLLIQASINGIIKGSVLRTRPFVYDPQTPLEEKQTIDARISFFSGHTSMTAAISFFTAKVFTEYVDDNTAKILIWSGAFLLPAVTAISRVNTHWHFPTDVMAGYVVGALVGYFVPELHKTKVNDNLSIYPSINLNKPMLSLQLKF